MGSQAMLFCLALSLTGFAQAQEHHHHEHSHATTAESDTTGDERFATDQALRTGMQQIRAAVTALEHLDTDRAQESRQVLEQADTIDRQVDYLIANCRLEPQADAVLHGIIGQLLSSSQALREAPDDRTALERLQAAVREYDARFDTTSPTD